MLGHLEVLQHENEQRISILEKLIVFADQSHKLNIRDYMTYVAIKCRLLGPSYAAYKSRNFSQDK